jgi:transposase InsO family protein
MAPATRSMTSDPSNHDATANASQPDASNTINNSNAGTGGPTPSNDNTTTTQSTPTTQEDILLTERFLTDPSWPADLILDLGKSNWTKWSRRLELAASGQGFARYLDGTLACPDVNVNPKGYWIWDNNDRSLWAFMLRHISPEDYEVVTPFRTHGAHAVYEALRERHEKRGLYAQVLLIKKTLEIRFDTTKSLDDTVSEIKSLHRRIADMGEINTDKLLTVFLMNALADQLPHLQSAIQSMSSNPGFCSAHVTQRIHEENELLRHREAQGLQTNISGITALAAVGKPRSRRICSNCKATGHLVDTCIKPGGKMAGRSLEDAQAAQRATSLKARAAKETTASAHIAATTTESSTTSSIVSVPSTAAPTPSPSPAPTANPASIQLNGVTYYPGQITAQAAMDVPATVAHDDWTGTVVHPDDWGFHAFLAMNDPPRASINWDTFSRPIVMPQVDICPTAYSVSRPPAEIGDSSFAFDTGATCHISPVRSDFKTLRPISKYPVKGLGGATVYAIGIGEIELRIAKGCCITLHDVLFIPESTIRLISVITLNRSDGLTTHFDSNSCWVTNRSGATIARGSVSDTRNLYFLPTPSLRVTHSKSGNAFYSAHVPDVETWHRRLGHCSVRTVVDMARNHAVKGMPIDLSSMPPKCNFCILGKQTRTTVPSMREGLKATRRLERVFVDLCGPMHVTSRSGRLYSMNLIDDYSSFVWSLPLKSKDEASHVLQAWHRVVENQCGERLKILVTDNGEIVSKSTSDWCSAHGIEHQLTAPYTSAQNGRAERLHRTLFNKARSMRLACDAPPNLWEEFCATAAYLTNLTASASIAGKTPYELWFQHIPSLSHLREIGCRAFALIPTINPKILQRSVPCTLIGYAPRAKAYRLWDRTSNRIFNSFHVAFIEHLEELPRKLSPGKIVESPDIESEWYNDDTETNHDHADANTQPTPHPPPPPPSSPPPTAPSLRRSTRLISKHSIPQNDNMTAFLSEYSPYRDSHDLIPLDLSSDSNTTLDEVLTAITGGSLEPDIDSGDDPSWADALRSPEREYWISGARDELKSLEDLKVFVLVPRSDVPRHQRPLTGKLVCKRKRDDSGNITRYKVRYVARGYAQQYGIDYDKTTAPTARLESFRTILHVAATLNWDLQQLDIKTAFLHGILPPEETMYMEQPRGFEAQGKETWVMKLMKSIYGMKQASRIWNQTFHQAVLSWGFERLPCEWCVYRRQSSTGTIIFAVHVDDIVTAASSAEENARFKTELRSKWEISDLGAAKFALGIAISRDFTSRTVTLSQTALIDRVVEEFNQRDAHPVSTPMVAGLQLRRPEKGTPTPEHTEWAKRTPYRSLIGSLMYLAVGPALTFPMPSVAFLHSSTVTPPSTGTLASV